MFKNKEITSKHTRRQPHFPYLSIKYPADREILTIHSQNPLCYQSLILTVNSSQWKLLNQHSVLLIDKIISISIYARSICSFLSSTFAIVRLPPTPSSANFQTCSFRVHLNRRRSLKPNRRYVSRFANDAHARESRQNEARIRNDQSNETAYTHLPESIQSRSCSIAARNSSSIPSNLIFHAIEYARALSNLIFLIRSSCYLSTEFKEFARASREIGKAYFYSGLTSGCLRKCTNLHRHLLASSCWCLIRRKTCSRMILFSPNFLSFNLFFAWATFSRNSGSQSIFV